MKSTSFRGGGALDQFFAKAVVRSGLGRGGGGGGGGGARRIMFRGEGGDDILQFSFLGCITPRVLNCAST